jgi:hypothetical protein
VGGGASAFGGAGPNAIGGNAAGGGSDHAGAGQGGAPPNNDLGPPGPDGFVIDVELASHIKSTAPTTVGIVKWALANPGLVEAHIEFGLDTTYGMTAPVDLGQFDYRTVLVGMKPAKTYHFRVVATDGLRAFTSADQTLTTGAPTTAVSFGSFSVKAAAQVDKGFFIGSYWTTQSDSGVWTPFIADTDGDIVWWYTDPTATQRIGDGIARARLSADSEDIWLVNSANASGEPLRRVSIDTLDVETYPNTAASHDICAVSGGLMAYLDYGTHKCTSVVEIDKTGETKEVFDSTSFVYSTPKGCHGNSLRYSQREDEYVFSDDFNDVFVLGRDGSVAWRLSEKVSGGNASWGGLQHGTQLLDASLLIYANEASGFPNAQALEFGLDGSLIKAFASAGGGDYFGDVQRMPSGNTLIDYAYSGLIQEVDADDQVLLEIRSSQFPFGYLEFRQSLYGTPLDIRQ